MTAIAVKPRRTFKDKLLDADALRKTVHDLAERIADGDSDEAFDEYLTWISRLHRYSWGNICLMQWEWDKRLGADPTLPPLSHVTSYRRWKKVGRQVSKGQKGIPILVPWDLKGKLVTNEDTGDDEFLPPRTVFRVGYVFDVSQTEGDDIPNFKRDLGESPFGAMPLLLELAQDRGIRVHFLPLGEPNGVSGGGLISINQDRPPGIQVQTLVHELAHEMLHQNANGNGSTPHDRALMEGEAEAVCVVVMRALGHDTASNGAAYIRSHGADAKLVLRSMERITRTAREILKHVHGEEEATE